MSNRCDCGYAGDIPHQVCGNCEPDLDPDGKWYQCPDENCGHWGKFLQDWLAELVKEESDNET